MVFSDESDNELIDDHHKQQAPKVDFFKKIEKMNKKKQLQAVDHSKMDYKAFRKDFYIECKEIRNLSEEDTELFRNSMGDIKVRGIDCTKPIMNWYQCGLSDKLLDVLIEKNKFEAPFAIQCQAIPTLMSGRDCIGVAETGSGKTLAFVIPMLRHIKYQDPLREGDGPIAIIMVPTRELALQVYNESKMLCKTLNIRCACIYGGGNLSGQLANLKRGAEIVVCTPGRMIDVLTKSNGRFTNLRRVTYVVLDEADRMFDLGFEPQISKILMNVRPDR